MADAPQSWFARLRAGLSRSSDKLGDSLSSVFTKSKLDDAMLEEIEEALIAADLGPAMAARVSAKLAAEKYDKAVTEAEVRRVVADEIEKVLIPVARPLEVVAFPRPQTVLVVGVNGSGKTTTIAKLAHLSRSRTIA
jgi:fused signal recognition particle receptor